MYVKKCALCGEEFETRYKHSKFCKGPHYKTCPVCGKKFQVDDRIAYCYENWDKVCCSKKCGHVYAHSKRTSKQKQETSDKVKRTKLLKYGDSNYNNRTKAVETCIERYGVDSTNKLDSVKSKARETKLERYRDENYNNSDKRRRTNVEKYGTDNAAKNEQVKKKARQTNLKRYGVTSQFKREEFKEKSRKTSLAKYGTEYPIQSEQVQKLRKENSLKKHGVDSPSKLPLTKQKVKKTMIERYGNWYTGTEEYREKVKTISKEVYGVNHFQQSNEVKEKRKSTNMDRYGTSTMLTEPKARSNRKKVLLEKYGVDSPMKVPSIRSKQAKSAKKSLLEVRVSNLLSQYNIEFEQQYVISKNGHTHAFDFYIPKYKILVDADGKYYHSYLSDPDGKHVRNDYDDVRLYLVPEDHIFILAVEGQEEQDVKQVYKAIKQMDEGVYDYEGELFRWCRTVGFPYPVYTTERMEKDWTHLCLYENDVYKPTCRLGMSIVSNFHKSIYDCHVGRSKSVREAWHDDEALKRVIANRLVDQNTVNPSKLLKGFNVCKEAPVVSRFNPVLAKHLVRKYLNEFDEVFDPFSGFSGRLLGTASCDKKYVGQDIRWQAVEESNQIIRFLDLKECSVVQQDVLKSFGTYECLLTCPPYSDKETYGGEVCYKSCDEWIDECLKRFKCKKYVFVVDETEKYKDFVVEEVQNSSHFSKAVERVVALNLNSVLIV